MDLSFAGENFILLADRAMLWPRRKMLIVADTHFGKDALFQARGILVPNDVTSNDLQRLSALLDLTESKELLILGDFFHGKESNDAEMTKSLHAWRARHAGVTMTIVRGNHDAHSGDPCDSLCIDCLNSLRFDSIKFQHAPRPPAADQPDTVTQRGLADEGSGIEAAKFPPNQSKTITPQDASSASLLCMTTAVTQPVADAQASDFDAEDDFIICGHIHPATTLTDFDGKAVKVPCFVLEPNQLILPAFGRFTGTCAMERVEGRQFLIASHGRVLRAPT